jgi:hypothetical protein
MSVPGPPNITELPFASPNTLEFEWGPPLVSNGAILGYRFTIDDTQVLINSNERYYKQTGLINGQNYFTSLEASNANGWGAKANFREFQPGSEPTLGPSTFTTILNGSNASLIWTPPSTLPDAPIIGYALYAQDSFYKQTLSYSADAFVQSNYYANLTDFGEYYKYTAYAVNYPGWSPSVTIEPLKIRGDPLWATQIGGASNQVGPKIATDNSNNVIITGEFINTMSIYNYSSAPINSGAVTTSLFGFLNNTNANSNDTYIVKYNQNGNAEWATRVGGTGPQSAPVIATDLSGNIYITGVTATNATIRFYSYSAIDASNNIVVVEDGNMVTQTNSDIFLAKYDSSGVLQWATNIGGNTGTGGFESQPTIAVDSSGNVYVAGQANNCTVFNYSSTNPSTKAITRTPRCAVTTLANYGILLVQYSPDGFANWVVENDGAGNDAVPNLCTDASNNVYISGVYPAAMVIFSFNNISGTTLNQTQFGIVPFSATNDIYLVKYNSLGIVQWVGRFAGGGNENFPFIASDYLNNIYITYRFLTSQTTLFNAGTTVDASGNIIMTSFGTIPVSASTDGCIAKYNSSGQGVWATRITLSSPTSIATDLSGNVYVTGTFTQSNQPLIYNFGSTSGGGTITTSLYARMTTSGSGAGSDTLLVKYNTSGIAQWATRINGPTTTSDESGGVVTSDSLGNLYLAGRYNSSPVTINKPTLAPSVGNIDNSNISIANGTITPYGTLANEGLYDTYIVKFQT